MAFSHYCYAGAYIQTLYELMNSIIADEKVKIFGENGQMAKVLIMKKIIREDLHLPKGSLPLYKILSDQERKPTFAHTEGQSSTFRDLAR